MKISIPFRWSWRAALQVEIPDDTEARFRLRVAVEIACRSGAVLSDAVLRGAVLSDAVLSGAVLSDADLRGAVLSDAVLSGAVLSGADLRGADLRGADLSGAVLSDADLRGAVLSDAVLSGAVLSGADLRGADLRGADLSGAVLRDADLRGAVLSDAVLSGAVLSGADLRGADLRDAKNIPLVALRPIRADIFDILLRAVPEVPALLAALREGRVDGSTYTGPCACLCGTIANVRGVSVETLDYRDCTRPAERWFLGIREGDTPETNPHAKITEEWILEFLALTSPAIPAAAE